MKKHQNEGSTYKHRNDDFDQASTLPYPTASMSAATGDQSGLFCPNCGARLEAQKCKLFCRTTGCGYLVTCSEW